MKHAASSSVLWAVLLLAQLFCSSGLTAESEDICAVCGGQILEINYSFEDKVTLEKKHVCKECEKNFPDCFVCGLPANTNKVGYVELSDQRSICSRDARTAVLNEDDGVRICREVRDGLDHLLSRFTSFPETNISITVMDRVSLQSLFKIAGNDYQCPNVWGLTRTETNHNRLQYQISLMTGLPLSWFQFTCAHEYGHTWVSEHLSADRKAKLGRDAEEGFCELLAFMYVESINDEQGKKMILRNAYTRGQIDLFVAAYQTYGFEEVLEWMQFGVDTQLSGAEPGRIRQVALQRQTNSPAPVTFALERQIPTAAPEILVLKAIFWDQKHPLAIINDRTFGPNEEAKVRIGQTNVLVRCLEISPNAVELRLVDNQQHQTLRLKSK